MKVRPRIIWTCVRMPHMDGLELIEAIKKNPFIRNAKIMVYTAGSEEIRNQVLAIGADVYLRKGDSKQLEEGLKIVADFLKSG